MSGDDELKNLEADGIFQKDVEQAKIYPPKKPDFPFLVFMFALCKDIADWVTLGVGGTIINIIAVPVMFFYLRGKGDKVEFVKSGKAGSDKKRLYKQYIFTMILEFIPFINFIPQNTIFVIRVYLSEVEQVDKILSYLENLPKQI